MIIEIVNRIIKIPPTCKLIMQGEQQEENMIKIPKKILTDNIEKTKVFILTQLNDNDVKEEELELIENNEDDYDNNYYRWDLKEEHTAEKGELKIQIKIKRGTFTEEPIPPVEEPENPEEPTDPEEPDLPKEDENEDNKGELENPDSSENEEIALLNENEEGEDNKEENEGKDDEEPLDPPDEEFDPNPSDLDPDFLVPYGDNTNGIWYSYKNSFCIEESLMETVDLNGG